MLTSVDALAVTAYLLKGGVRCGAGIWWISSASVGGKGCPVARTTHGELTSTTTVGRHHAGLNMSGIWSTPAAGTLKVDGNIVAATAAAHHPSDPPMG